MSAEILFGLIFITTAFIGRIIIEAINAGLFDKIAVKLTNYIVSRMERNEREDI